MTDLKSIANSLRAAYTGAPIKPIVANLTKQYETKTSMLDAAYKIQDINTQFWTQQGRKVTGRKIGLTSKSVQEQLGVSEPDFGMLFDDMARPHGDRIDFNSLIQPKIEAEIAFRANSDITEAPESEEHLAELLYAAYPALEIVDSRIENWKISLSDTVADNASSALYVLGTAISPVDIHETISAKMQMFENDDLISTGSGNDCMGGPLTAALWLVRKMINVGRPVRTGDIILSGALGPMAQVKPNKKYRAEIEGFGAVEVYFGPDDTTK